MTSIRTFVTGGLGLTLTAAVLAAAPARAMVARTDDPTPCTKRIVTAHEGYTKNADGDTVESQVAAFDIGVNNADSDLWMTKDGYIVQRHDNDLSTTTNGKGLITNSTLAYIQSLHTRRHHEAIPLLADSLAIATASEPFRALQFETKWSMNGTSALTELDNEINQYGMASHVVIYSAYLDQLETLESIDPSLTTWYKATGTPPPSELPHIDGVMLNVSDVTKANVEMYHAAGITVTRMRRTTESLTTWDRFVKTGADGLMTVDPATIVDWCRAIPAR